MRERGQGNIHFSCSADHEQDWQPYPVDPYSAICDDLHTCIHAYIPYNRGTVQHSIFDMSFELKINAGNLPGGHTAVVGTVAAIL